MMAATKQKVTLSLDSDGYRAVRAILARIPGKPSVSGLIDDLFREFIGSVGPLLDEVEADPAVQARALLAFHGNLVRESSVRLDEVIRTLDAKEAGEEK